MSPEERQMLADLFERVRGAAANPRDPQAEAFINDAVRALPFAPYVLAQTVLVQQHALEAATQRIADLEAQAKAVPSAAAQGETSFLGNIGRSLFGGAPAPAPAPQAARPGNPYDASGYQRSAAPAPPPGYAPQPQPQAYAAAPQPGPWGAPAPSAGGGFLSGALHTAAGVAGGMVLANAVEGLLGGRGGLFGGSGLMGGGLAGGGLAGGSGFMPSAFAEPRETVNNYFINSTDASGQRPEDALQDQDQDQDQAQDDAQDVGYDDGSSDFSSDV